MAGFSQTPFGFHIHLENGWTVSIQFGSGNYCRNRDLSGKTNPFTDTSGSNSCDNAEIAAWPTEERRHGINSCDDWYQFDDGYNVRGWQSPSQVLEFLNMVSLFHNVKYDRELTPADVQTASKKWKPILKDWGIDY